METSGRRIERDSLGEVAVPESALWGAQTQRAIENYPVSGLSPHRAYVTAVIWIKRCAALAHGQTGRLDTERVRAIVWACDEVLSGRWQDQFVVDPFQSGAGTSHHMNVNEVLANLANESLGSARGSYVPVHPNDHVNMGQSTNDVIPTAIRLSALSSLKALDDAFSGLSEALKIQAQSADHIIKVGRTHLQDALPIRFGQVFAAWSSAIDRALARVNREADDLRDVPLGGSAIGTGVNVEAGWTTLVLEELRQVSHLELRAGQPILGTQSQADAAAFSGALRVLAIELSRIASDLRLLAMGPRTGIHEIDLPAVQPGSSIMPGKVNPSIAEMVNQVCLQVIGLDSIIAAAAGQAQLELNVMMPLIAHDLLTLMGLMTNAVRVFTERCVAGMRPNAESCEFWVERSSALATALMPRFGYARSAQITQQALAQGLTIRQWVLQEGLLTAQEATNILDLRRLTEPGVPS
jgi:aspartate ammonia-lyase